VPQSPADILMKPQRFYNDIRAARDYLRSHDIKIVHSDDGPIRYLWFYAAKLAGARYVLTQRTLLKKTLEKRLSYPFMDAVICNSEACRDSLPYVPKSVVQGLCYPPITIDNVTPPPKGARKVIGFVANIHKRKRPDVFIKMAAQLHACAPEAYKFVMAGAFADGMEAPMRALVAECGLGDVFEFTGFVSKPQELLASIDVLVAPAEQEAFGRVLIEAMAHGVPVVAANDGGHKEIIESGENGFLVSPGQPDIFAGTVESILGNEGFYTRLSKAAKQRAQDFLGGDPAEFFDSVYRQIL